MSLFSEQALALAVLGAMATGSSEDLRILLDGLDRHEFEALVGVLSAWHIDAMEKANLDPAREIEKFRAKLIAAEVRGG